MKVVTGPGLKRGQTSSRISCNGNSEIKSVLFPLIADVSPGRHRGVSFFFVPQSILFSFRLLLLLLLLLRYRVNWINAMHSLIRCFSPRLVCTPPRSCPHTQQLSINNGLRGEREIDRYSAKRCVSLIFQKCVFSISSANPPRQGNPLTTCSGYVETNQNWTISALQPLWPERDSFTRISFFYI